MAVSAWLPDEAMLRLGNGNGMTRLWRIWAAMRALRERVPRGVLGIGSSEYLWRRKKASGSDAAGQLRTIQYASRVSIVMECS